MQNVIQMVTGSTTCNIKRKVQYVKDPITVDKDDKDEEKMKKYGFEDNYVPY